MSAPPPPGYGPDPRQGQQPGYGQQQQSGYGQQQPGYEQQVGYGQPPPMGPITTRMARLDPGPSQSFGVVGAALTAVGAILVIIAFTAVNWLTTDGLGKAHAGDLKKFLDQIGSAAVPVSKVYFSWLGWALLVAVVVLAILANLPSPIAKVFRILGAIVAALAIAATFLAIRLVSTSGPGVPSYSDYLKHARVGFYLAVAGFLLAGIGAAIGPSRTRR